MDKDDSDDLDFLDLYTDFLWGLEEKAKPPKAESECKPLPVGERKAIPANEESVTCTVCGAATKKTWIGRKEICFCPFCE